MAYFLTVLYITLNYLSPAEHLPALAPYRIMLLLLVGTSLITAVLLPMTGFSFRAPQIYLALGLMGSVGMSMLWMPRWLGGMVAALTEFTAPVAILMLVAINLTTVKRTAILAAVIVLISIYLTGLGYAAYHHGYRNETLIMFQWELNESTGIMEKTLRRIRAFGFLSDPNDLAQNFLISLAFLAAFWRKRRVLRNIFLVLLPTAVIAYGLFLTGSRGAAVGLLVLSVMLLKDRLGATGSLVAGGLLMLALVGLNFGGNRAVSMGESSAAGRLEAWSSGLQMLKSSPLFGVGYHMFTDHHERTAHNSFVLCFSELGLVGYFFWLGMIYWTISELRGLSAIRSSNPYVAEIAHWAQYVKIAFYTFLATSWFLSRTYVPTLYMLIGMSVALTEMARRVAPEHVPELTGRWFYGTIGLQAVSILVIYITMRFRF